MWVCFGGFVILLVFKIIKKLIYVVLAYLEVLFRIGVLEY
jgi:hypothetical protein